MKISCFFVMMGLSIYSAGHASAQSATHYSDEESTFGANGFLQQPSGTIGVTKCGTPALLTATRTYLLKDYNAYWGFVSECLRVVINHRSNRSPSDPPEIPSYLGVQIIAFYDQTPDNAVVLKRVGNFSPNGAPPYASFADRSFVSQELSQQEFNDYHNTAQGEAADKALKEFHGRVGVWHGIPQGGIHNSWDERYRFRDTRTYDTRLAPQFKTLENRLVKFTPYLTQGAPNDGPLTFNFNRRGAKAVAVKVFSPANADIEHSFLILYTNDQRTVSQVLNSEFSANLWSILSIRRGL